ncbi:hypothetical protein, conserved [Leishmania tarentolae]|uniref:Uncharacterized protein n=1 Tax=Leishmania tarentolae TaxID=5689 RepID=A0A640KLP4_LEITA|nr:hypothetical protein, conserved [Leishmania tarentolae]
MGYNMSKKVTFLGRHVGCHLWRAVADLCRRDSAVRVHLSSDAYLSAWSQFKRPAQVNVSSDDTVLLYISSFVAILLVATRVSAPLRSMYEGLGDVCLTRRIYYLRPDCTALQLACLGMKCA